MSVRRETIILELEDNASAEALRAAAGFKALDAVLDDLGAHASTVGRRFTSMSQRADKLATSMGKANAVIGKTDATLDSMGSRGLVRFASQTDRASASIDNFSGRLGLLGTAAMALGPALIPLGAAAIPAVATLTAGMGAAAGAAGVMILAFQGVGDAVSAVSDYRLEPTADNLAKVREEMEKLGPAGADFVMAIDRAMPAFRDLQMTAREGMFPGFTRGLDALVTQLPAVRNLVADLSTTVGTLGEASVNALTNDADWQEFFAHIGTDGASALEDFGRATGNFTAGVANLLEAMTGIGGGSAGMLETSRAFREWADNLEHTEGFKEFADYVRQSGPQVAEFLSATGSAMVGLIEAAAPWGQVVLPALTALADITGTIASSPIGPPLFAAAAAMLAFNKASALLAPSLDRGKASMAGFGSTLRQTGADLRTMSSSWASASKATTRDAAAMTAATNRLKGNLSSVGKQARSAGPGIAAFGFMASGAADKMGLSNAALLGMAGSMAGPWGAAIGAGIGLAVDFAQANDEVEESVSNAASAIASADFGNIGSQMNTANESLAKFKKDVESFSDGDVDWDFGAYMKGAKNWVEGIFGKSDLEELQERMAKTRTEFSNLVDAGAKLGEGFDIDVGGTKAQKLAALSELAQAASPAMTALGITFEDLGNAAARGDGSLDTLVGQITTWQAAADSTAGRTEAFGDAIANLGADALGTAHSAQQLAAALQGLMSPEQDLIGAQDAMSSTLNGLKDKVDATNKSLLGTSDAAIKNRAAISDGVTAIQNLSAAQAAAGESSIAVASTMNQQRQALINAGQAAGLSRKQVESLINQMGLTPDVVRTAFEAAGVEEVDTKTQRLTARFNNLPKKVRTDIATNGIPKSEADILRLQRKYHLTPRQVQTLAALRDNASGPIAAVIAALRAADGQSATTTIYHRTVNEIITISRGQSARPDRRLEPGQYADGGEVQGQRTPYGDKVLTMLAPGEEVISNRYGQADRFRRDRAMGLIPAYADGGTVGIPGYAKGGKVKVYGAPKGPAPLPKKGGPETRAYGFKNDHTERGWAQITRGLSKHEKALNRHGKRLERSLDKAEKAVDKAKDRLDYWNNKRKELKADVTSALTRNWWEDGNQDVWSAGAQQGTVAFAQQQWKQQSADSKKLAAIIKNLRKNGAGDAFIAEILRSPDPLAAADMFNRQTVKGMKTSEKLFLDAYRATQSAADSTSSIFADEQRKATNELRGLRKDVATLKKAINANHKAAEKTRKKTSAAKAAAKGARSKKR